MEGNVRVHVRMQRTVLRREPRAAKGLTDAAGRNADEGSVNVSPPLRPGLCRLCALVHLDIGPAGLRYECTHSLVRTHQHRIQRARDHDLYVVIGAAIDLRESDTTPVLQHARI